MQCVYYSFLFTSLPCSMSKGYFDAMYRSTLVGKFLATQMKDIIKQQEIIRQCIDMLQFLLEAVPPSMNEVT